VGRVHCPDCAMAVVVDPSGMCPEGHYVGAAGARIEAALGRDLPHPDEPQPWIGVVELEASEEPSPEPRQIRPVSIGHATSSADADTDGESTEMLRELHSLTDADEPADAQPEHRLGGPKSNGSVRTSRPTSHLAAVPDVNVRPRPTGGHQSADAPAADAFDELAALEAAVDLMASHGGASKRMTATTDAGATATGPAPAAAPETAAAPAPSEASPEPSSATTGGDSGRTILDAFDDISLWGAPPEVDRPADAPAAGSGAGSEPASGQGLADADASGPPAPRPTHDPGTPPPASGGSSSAANGGSAPPPPLPPPGTVSVSSSFSAKSGDKPGRRKLFRR
jgi:hypothetical protein